MVRAMQRKPWAFWNERERALTHVILDMAGSRAREHFGTLHLTSTPHPRHVE